MISHLRCPLNDALLQHASLHSRAASQSGRSESTIGLDSFRGRLQRGEHAAPEIPRHQSEYVRYAAGVRRRCAHPPRLLPLTR